MVGHFDRQVMISIEYPSEGKRSFNFGADCEHQKA